MKNNMPEISNLNEIYETQVNNLIALGYHEKLRKTSGQFREMISLPGLDEPAYNAGFQNLLLVIPKNIVSYRDQWQCIGIGSLVPIDILDDMVDDFATPDHPYWIQWQYGKIKHGKCKYWFDETERGLTLSEGFNLMVQYRNILNVQSIGCIGTLFTVAHHAPHFFYRKGTIEMKGLCRSAIARYMMMGGPIVRVYKNLG